MQVKISEWRGTYVLHVLDGNAEVGIGDAIYYSRAQAQEAADELLCRFLAGQELERIGETQAAAYARYPPKTTIPFKWSENILTK